MEPNDDIDPEFIAGLLALYYACNGSSKAHVPLQRFAAKLSEPYKPFASAILERVTKGGYVHIHKGRGRSYGINMAGVKKLLKFGLLPRKGSKKGKRKKK